MISCTFTFTFICHCRARKDRMVKVNVPVAVALKMLPQTRTTPMMPRKMQMTETITRHTAARITMLAPRMRMCAMTTTTTMVAATTTTTI